VKKLLILVLILLGGLAVWRKVQAQRADLDLWSEAISEPASPQVMAEPTDLDD
jgi:hypothetical protein